VRNPYLIRMVVFLILAFASATPRFAYAAGTVRITGMADFAFGSWTGTGDMVLADGTLCIYRGGTGGNKYRITASGSGSGGALTVAASSYTLAYSAGWKNTSGTSGTFTNLPRGTAVQFTSGDTASQTCSGGWNAAMQITFASADLSSAKMGDYSGVLTILVEPA
jgi:hypothetical protein